MKFGTGSVLYSCQDFVRNPFHRCFCAHSRGWYWVFLYPFDRVVLSTTIVPDDPDAVPKERVVVQYKHKYEYKYKYKTKYDAP